MSQKLLLIALSVIFTISICGQQRFVARLSGLQEVPPVASGATALCRATLFTGQIPAIQISCEYANLSGPLTGVAIHAGGGIGENAPVYTSLPITGGPTGSFTFVSDLLAPQFADLYRKRLYLQILTANFPGGEIRGQIVLTNSTYNDFDGDGRTDLTVYRSSNNTFYAQASLAGNLLERQLGQPGDSVSLTVDFDGDGRSDFSTARYNAEVLWRIFNSSTETLQETRWGSSALGDFFAAADYDGDGRMDIAVFRAGVWHVIESSTGFIRYYYFGQSGDVPAPNDFDRDGKSDLAVARSESGQRVWYIQRSTDGTFYSLPWGLSSDAFFTGRADWDGDGAADISVIRSESGQRVFYILRSSDNQLQIIRWGLTSDVVKLGDYDGDGRTDAALTRVAGGNRVFYILQSSTNTPRYETFGLPGDF